MKNTEIKYNDIMDVIASENPEFGLSVMYGIIHMLLDSGIEKGWLRKAIIKMVQSMYQIKNTI